MTARAAIVAVVLLVAACGPTRAHVVGSAEFTHIEGVFARTVDALNNHEREDWYSGWMGNCWVNWWGGHRKGLCFQWQEAIYPSVSGAAREVGWDAVGICLNENRGSEHHAVIVWDPMLMEMQDLLDGPPPRPAYVLDAWRRGKPDVFTLDEWLKHGVHSVRTSRLEDLDTPPAAPDSPAQAEAPEGAEADDSAAGIVRTPAAQRAAP